MIWFRRKSTLVGVFSCVAELSNNHQRFYFGVFLRWIRIHIKEYFGGLGDNWKARHFVFEEPGYEHQRLYICVFWGWIFDSDDGVIWWLLRELEKNWFFFWVEELSKSNQNCILVCLEVGFFRSESTLVGFEEFGSWFFLFVWRNSLTVIKY